MVLDSRRRLDANVSRLVSLGTVDRNWSFFGLTVNLTVETVCLASWSNDDNGLEMQEMIEWE